MNATLSHERWRRRAFATAYALMLMIVVGITLAAMGAWFATQLRRTRSADVAGQERQLLLAGTKILQSRLASGTLRGDERTPQILKLPDTLHDASLTVRLESGDNQHITARIDCVCGRSKMHQSVTLSHEADGWKVLDATLGGG